MLHAPPRHKGRYAAAVPACTTDSHHDLPIAPNRLDQKFAAERPNQVGLADITYVPTGDGWLYLAVVLDLFTPEALPEPATAVELAQLR